MDLATFRSRISSVLGLDPTAAGTEEVLVDGWVNEGVIRVLADTQSYVDKDTMTTTAAQSDYTLDAAVLRVLNLVYTASDGAVYRLQRVSVDEILDRRAFGPSSQDSISFYALAGNNLFMVYPTPSAVGTITVYYVPRPTPLSSGTHDPSAVTYGGVPTEYHKAIELWALSQAANYDDDQTSRYGQDYRQDYELELRRIRRSLNLKGGRTPPRLQVARGSRFVPRDPSADF